MHKPEPESEWHAGGAPGADAGRPASEARSRRPAEESGGAREAVRRGAGVERPLPDRAASNSAPSTSFGPGSILPAETWRGERAGEGNSSGAERPPGSISSRVLCWSWRLLAAAVWASALLFGIYILAFYAMALLRGDMARWNGNLPGLYVADLPAATTGIGLHFAAGGVILVLGGVQLLGSVRRRAPALHRWIGRIYAPACALTAIGGLVFIAVKGTIGGAAMNVGFGLYGVLMLLASVETVRHAMAGRLDRHRAWGIRLFALAIGSWLYRMELGSWLLVTGGIGHDNRFQGPFDVALAFLFYLPNLAVAEAVIRRARYRAPVALEWTASLVLTGAAIVLGTGTWFFVTRYWGPAIVELVR